MSSDEMKIVIGLHRVVSDFDRKSAVLMQSSGLTLSQFGVLEVLYHKGPLTRGQVRDKILSSNGTITMVINNLEKQEYIEKRISEEDRRICYLHLTSSGRKLIQSLIPKNDELIHEYMSVLSEEEKEKLVKLLKKLDKSI